jgi:hypothetical protein
MGVSCVPTRKRTSEHCYTYTHVTRDVINNSLIYHARPECVLREPEGHVLLEAAIDR